MAEIRQQNYAAKVAAGASSSATVEQQHNVDIQSSSSSSISSYEEFQVSSPDPKHQPKQPRVTVTDIILYGKYGKHNKIHIFNTVLIIMLTRINWNITIVNFLQTYFEAYSAGIFSVFLSVQMCFSVK